MIQLKEIRELRELMQKQLASDIKISNSQLCKYEKGNSEMPSSIIIACALGLNVSTDMLLGLEPIEFDTLDTPILREESETSYKATLISHMNFLKRELSSIKEDSSQRLKLLEDMRKLEKLYTEHVENLDSYYHAFVSALERLEKYEENLSSDYQKKS